VTPQAAPGPTAKPDRIAVSPDGAWGAFVVGPPDHELAGLWAGRLDGSPTRRQTEIPVTNLAWSPDSNRLAFGTQESLGTGLTIVDVDAEGAPPTTDSLPGYAEQVVWSHEGLFVLIAEPGAASASLTSGRPLGGAPSDPAVTRAAQGWRRIWRVGPAGSLEPQSPEGLTVWEMAPVPGGGHVAVASEDPSEAGWYRPSLVHLGPAAFTLLHASRWQLSSPAVSPDGLRVAFVEGWASDRGLLAGDVLIISIDGSTTTPVKAGLDITALTWAETGRLWVAGWHHLGTAWGWTDDPASSVRVQHEQASCFGSPWHPQVVPAGGDEVLTARSTPDRPPEIVRLSPGAPPRPWSALNSPVPRPWELSEQRWVGAVGTEIEGLLALPRTDDPAPLVVLVHGGPSLAWHHAWDLSWTEPLTVAGYAVLLANPRGSVGRGQAFGRANLGDPAGAELDDLIAGVAHCERVAGVDTGRVAFLGASYGGYMAAWAAANGLVSTGVVIAGISDLLSCRNASNNAPFYDELLSGAPGNEGSRYLERSPVVAVTGRSAPVLLLHGAEDRCVPVGQADELFNEMQAAGVEVELVVYPREGHQIVEPDHVRDRNERIVAWLDTHLR
jgi:dipeptidyl aminopeptidase/acylaminoacyl peptidase